jgi:pimeloyl-ACP methyl ester carboxylesterase
MIPNPAFHGGHARQVARIAEDEIAGVRVVMIPGAGHTVHHDAPEAFNNAVRTFLQ